MDFSSILNALDGIKTWLVGIFTGLIFDVINVLFDLFVWIIDKLFWLVLSVFSFIPSPDVMGAISFSSLFSSMPPVVGWLVVKLRLAEAVLIIVNAAVFYIIRRLITLGIW